MPFLPIPGSSEKYALLSFDAAGQEVPEGGRLFSDTLLEQAKQEQPTNVFFFSHGWKGDLPAAIDQYNRWIGAMVRQKADRERMGPNFKPMWIGLHWPSLPFGEENLGAISFSPADPQLEKLLDEAVAHFGGGDAVRQPLEVIFRASVEDAGAVEVPPPVLQAYRDLAQAIGFNAGAGAGAAPDEEGEALDPQGALEATNLTGASFGLGDRLMSGLLSGVRQLSFWTMKKRARTVGENGMHRFIAALMNTTQARVHLMGHSFGCIVTSSIIAGPNGNTPLPRPVNSVALVQGAFSLWAFGDQGQVPGSVKRGYFNPALPKAVSGPFLTTQSQHDTAVGVYYPAAVFLDRDVSFAPANLPKSGAIGTFGIQGTQLAQTLPMLDENSDYSFEGGRIYNLTSDTFIKKMDGASGAHSDIDGPQVAHAIWQAALASQLKEMATHG